MKNYPTTLMACLNSYFYRSACVLTVLFFAFLNRSNAAISITVATGGTNICSAKAADGSGPAFTAIGNIVITEGSNSDFGATGSGTITISAPSGWQFNTSTLPTVSTGGTGITVTRVFTSGNLVISRTMTVFSALATNSITIAGLQVQATTTGSGAGTIKNSAQSGTWSGLAVNTNLGNLSLQAAPAAVTVTGGGAVCATTTLTASGGGGGTIYYQGTTSNGTGTGTPSTSQVISTNGTYYFRSMGSGACWGPQGSAAVTINSLPAAVTVTGGGSFCGNTTINASGGSGGTIYFQNTVSGGTSTATAGTSAVISGSGTYYFRARSSAGCWGTQGSVVVTINPPAGAVTATGGGTFCENTTINASGGTGGTIYYQGSVSDGTSTTTPATSAVVNTSGTYYFRARTAAGCWGTESDVAVTINPPAGVVSVTGGGAYCGSTTISATVSGDGTIYYQGTTAGGTSTAILATTANITSSGVYYFRAQTAEGCWGDEGSVAVTIDPPAAAVSVTGGGAYCGNTTISASGGSGGTIYYQGNTSGGTSTTTAGNTASITTSGTYYFRAQTPAGCWGAEGSVSVTINPVPGGITGPLQVCVDGSISLDNPVGGGTWGSSASATASVNSMGTVAGEAAGTATITYTLTGDCYTTSTFTVNPLPAAIGGPLAVCEESAITVTDADADGVWTSIPVSAATINSSGSLTGIAAGNVSVIYMLPTGCMATKIVTVNATPENITGPSEVCREQVIDLFSLTAGGTWSSNAELIAPVDIDGNVTGLSDGNATISYALANGCYRTRAVTVNPLPSVIAGNTHVCVNSSITLTNSILGGTWSSPDATVSVGATTGLITGFSDGTATITYTLETGCTAFLAMTVDPLPATITGINELCVEGTTELFNFTPDGTWSSTATGIAEVHVTGGVVTGMADGVVDVVYTLPTGCTSAASITVHPLPDVIMGIMEVCHGLTTALSSGSMGATWSSSDDTRATVDGSGIVTGVLPGNAMISYSFSTGCRRAVEVIVNPLPAAIAGDMEVCLGNTTVYTNSTGGGGWLCSCIEPGLAIDGGGIFTAGSAGTTTITYALPTGCQSTAELTVDPLPAAISGPTEVCEGLSVTLTNADAGGTWSSADPDVSVGVLTGNITGISQGTAIVTYTADVTGCIVTETMVVHGLPDAITGATQVCHGQLTVLGGAPAGGTWSSADAGIVAMSSGGGAFGVTAGVTDVTYTSSFGCSRVMPFTVNALPASISGTVPVCVGASTVLSNATPDGTWSVSSSGAASITAAGLLIGVVAGNETISYSLATGCYRTAIATVNALPEVITGSDAVCRGLSTTLACITTDGTWSSNADLVATINTGGLVMGESDGTTHITYMLSTGCYSVKAMTVNSLPLAITGSSQVCHGLTTPLGCLPSGGTWSSSDGGIVNVHINTGVAGGTTAGNASVTYTLPTGCISVGAVTVNPLPTAITGVSETCVGLSATLGNVGGGTWISAMAAVADVNSSGEVTAYAAGTATITYTLPTGCIATRIFTANPLPAPFSGQLHVCEGLTTSLGNALSAGTWLSSDDVVADIALTTGLVSGHVAGTVDITYTLATGCTRSQVVTVDPAVPAITGTNTVCEELTTSLSNAMDGGIWISGNAAVATVELVSGMVTGLTAGTAQVTYGFPTGCISTNIVTVNPLPSAISGTLAVCTGLNTTLSDATIDGTWSGGAAGVASIDGAGIVTAMTAGITQVTYTLLTGCIKSAEVTVNPLPVAQVVTGGGSYCSGGTGVVIGIGGTQPLTTYRLYKGSLLAGTIYGAGVPADFGSFIAEHTYTVKATTTTTGCVNDMTGSAVVTITPLITPSVSFVSSVGDTLCNGTATTFSATPVNGGTTPVYNWLVNNVSVGAGSTYSYAPVDGDSVKVQLTSSEACPAPATVIFKKKMIVIENRMPTVSIGKTSGDSICQFTPALFAAASTWGGEAPVYTWRRNTVDIATGESFSYIPSDGDVITCRLTSNFRCRLANTVMSGGISLDVDSVYIPHVVITAEPGLVVAPLTKTTLIATTTGAGTAPVYQWHVNNLPVPGAQSPVYTGTFNDNDVVTCVVYGTGACGLPSFNMVTMTVREGVEIVQPGAIKSDLTLLPNPNKGQFNIVGQLNISTDISVSLQVTDMLGQVVYDSKVIAIGGTLNERVGLRSSLANGMYLLNLSTDSERKVFHFVVKQ